MWSMGFGEEGGEGGEQLAPDGGGEMGASLAEAFLPVRPFARPAAFHACIAKDDLQKRSARRSQQGAPTHPGRTVSFGTSRAGGQPALCALCRTSLQVVLCYAGMESSQARGEGRGRGSLAPRFLPPQATPRLESGHSYSSRSLVGLIHIPSAFAFKNPHPKCHSYCRYLQLSSFLSSPLSRNFIGLAGSGCRAFFPMADLHNCLGSQRHDTVPLPLPSFSTLPHAKASEGGGDEKGMLEILYSTRVAYFINTIVHMKTFDWDRLEFIHHLKNVAFFALKSITSTIAALHTKRASLHFIFK